MGPTITLSPGTAGAETFQLVAAPDKQDTDDWMYEPQLGRIPVAMGPRIMQDVVKLAAPRCPRRLFNHAPVRNQGQEGACTGFGLATMIDTVTLTREARDMVSSRMLYEAAQKYDEWPGENYQGSSNRGAVKGWQKHGVCLEHEWPYRAGDDGWTLTEARQQSAYLRPCGAYYRVDAKNRHAMVAAIAETRAVFVSGAVHEGWERTDAQGVVPFNPQFKVLGGHAWTVVGYCPFGYIGQNSWGASFGKGGFFVLTYDDWDRHHYDAWVAHPGAPAFGRVD